MKQLGAVFAAAVVLAAAAPPVTRAQVAPNDRWLTIETPRFRVHFTGAVEEQARRAAVIAERAYDALATELVPPRGPIDLVIADNVDFSNGYATIFPSNRIVIYSHPPVEIHSLRNYDDWATLVITHELVHVFHLDRSRGWWRAAQRVFGRNPLIFPNVYSPIWLLEGLAVYYESRLTGSGRLEGTGHELIARAAAVGNALPRLSDVRSSSSRFPGGDAPYAYGALLFEHLARSRGPKTIGDFVERSSAVPLPMFASIAARRSFGTTLQRAFRDWSDSVLRAAPADRAPLPGWRQLTPTGRYAFFPRWLGDTALAFTANTGKETAGSYRVTLSGDVRRIGRRNSMDVSVPLANGGSLFAQQDFTDLYTVRSDLYVEQNGIQRRLTRGARLSRPDVTRMGEILAVQAVPGTTRLVVVSAHGGSIAPITASSLDVQWAEPRWSPEGTHIAAVRFLRGGYSEIVVLERDGSNPRVVARGRSVQSAPSWSGDSRKIFFMSDRSGSPQLYEAAVGCWLLAIGNCPAEQAAGSFARVSNAATGVFEPELSPNGEMLAANHYRADGHHIGVAPAPGVDAREPDIGEARRRATCPNCLAPTLLHANDPAAFDTSAARRYSPAATLRPRYWFPLLSATEERGLWLGALTSGSDVIGRHSYAGGFTVSARRGQIDLGAVYRYSGLGQPLLDFSLEQDWGESAIYNSADVRVGNLQSRSRSGGLRATVVRRRARTLAFASAGAEVEALMYRTDPDSLRRRLADGLQRDPAFPMLTAQLGWSNTQRPSLSISQEDGISLATALEQRWERGVSSSATRRAIGVASAYKSLDLPGFAHHVVAIRAAGGVADRRALARFSAGGISGGSLALLPGYAVGDAYRNFGVRGFPSGTEQGTRAWAASIEYRAPISAPSRRYRLLPLFVDRVSAAIFMDAARAYCPTAHGDAPACVGVPGGDTPALASAGGELNVDTAGQVELPFRLRIGAAFPISGRELARRRAELYVTFGSAF